jgi:hypothetical protein
MAIKLRTNQYQGVNAHLQSILQQGFGGWEEFHSAHIIDIARAIDRMLPSRYIALPERSFQITAIAAEERAVVHIRKAVPDTSVFERNPRGSGSVPTIAATAPTMTLPAVEVFDDPEDYLTAVAIKESGKRAGEPVAWVELVSPSNKPFASGWDEYQEKRLAALMSGIVMVEIDYLHETRPVIRRLPRYPDAGSFPYYIAVTTPRPTFKEGLVDIYGFVDDQSIPKVRIPLLDNDSVTVDFDAAYHYTYESLRLYSDEVGYEQEPPNIKSYRVDDQVRIRAKMEEVAKAHETQS